MFSPLAQLEVDGFIFLLRWHSALYFQCVFPPEIFTTDGVRGVTSWRTSSWCGSTAVFHNVTHSPVCEIPLIQSDPDFFHECKMHSNLAPPAPPSPTPTDLQPGSVLTWQNSSCPLFKPFLYGLHSSRFPLPAVESTCGRRTRRKLMKIVGGTVATIESHPWVAVIFWRSKSKESVFRCGGSLISACWVLTAAHCFPDG